MRNSFEGAALESADIDRMHELAMKAIEEGRIMETDEADIERVESLEGEFAQGAERQPTEIKKIADIFEGAVLEHGEMSSWFGDTAHTHKTSRYDDYVNGVDLLVEFAASEGEESKELGLAADVTFTSDTTKKFDRLRAKIRNGELIEVKYPGTLSDEPLEVPEVIIGADKRTVMEIGELWLGKRHKELGKHRIQIQILRQIEGQLEVLGLYARSVGQEMVAQEYESRLGTIRGILAEKADIERQVRYELMDDTVHSSIMSFIARWKRELTGVAKAA